MIFTTTPQTLTAGVTSGTITVQLEDAFNNVATASSTQTLLLTTTSSGQFRDNATGNTPITSVTILGGTGSVSFKYNDTLVGTPTLTVTDNALTTPTATQTETVTAATASQLAFTTLPQTLTAGVTSNTITVQLEDAFGNFTAAAGNAQTISLSSNSTGTNVFTPTSLTINAGLGSASFTYNDQKAGTPTLTATDSTLTTTTVSQTETVNAAAATQMVFTNTPLTLTAGVTSGNLTIQLEDQFGNFTNATSPQTITLGTTSTGPVVFAPTSLSIASGSGIARPSPTTTRRPARRRSRRRTCACDDHDRDPDGDGQRRGGEQDGVHEHAVDADGGCDLRHAHRAVGGFVR